MILQYKQQSIDIIKDDYRTPFASFFLMTISRVYSEHHDMEVSQHLYIVQHCNLLYFPSLWSSHLLHFLLNREIGEDREELHDEQDQKLWTQNESKQWENQNVDGLNWGSVTCYPFIKYKERVLNKEQNKRTQRRMQAAMKLRKQ